MKRIISIFLVISIVLTFGGAFMIQAHAELVTAVVGGVLVGLAGGAIAALSAGLTESYMESRDELIADYNQGLIDKINNGAIQNGELIQIEYIPELHSMYWAPVDNLNEHDAAFAEYLSDYMNDNAPKLTEGFLKEASDPDKENAYMTSELYSEIKTAATNAFTSYWNNHILNSAIQDKLRISEDYKFDYNMPVGAQYIQSPEYTGAGDISGWYFEKPVYVNNYNGEFSSNDVVGGKLFGCELDIKGDYEWNDDVSGHQHTVYGYIKYATHPAYRVMDKDRGNVCRYIIYNNDIYYNWADNVYGYVNQLYARDSGYTSSFYNDKGQKLSDIAGYDGYYNMYYGVCFNINENSTRHSPLETIADTGNTISADDLSSGGGTISLAPFPTDNEKSVGQAQLLGLIPQNAKLEIAPDGTILSADGISIDTLAQMIENLKSTDYNFEDAKAFYDTCAGILTQIRTNTGETSRILSNVAANTAAISTINTAISGLKALEQSQDTHLENIESYAAAIAQALAMTEEQVNSREDIDINGYGIKHTGLVESEFVISKIPLVNQCNELVMMLIDGDYYTDTAPSFKFDADLNHDGVYEVYNALDLSFLDTPLSNTHLEDKNRFNYSVPMTIRGFLHLLIILICYISFAFKVIRKIPGLFSGGESAAEDAISRTEVTYK